MTWYAAHLIQYARFLDELQDLYPCYENVVLIEAETAESARSKATEIGNAAYGPTYGGPFTYAGRPAEWAFAGIRKVTECDNMDVDAPSSRDSEFRPTHGTELTYSELEVDNSENLAKLISGEPVTVIYYR